MSGIDKKVPLVATMYIVSNDMYLRLEAVRGGPLWYGQSAEFGWSLLDLSRSWDMERMFWRSPAKGDVEFELAKEDHRLLEQIIQHLESNQEGSNDDDCRSGAGQGR